MKIIGKTDEGFMLEAHADEVANLIGYYSHYEAHTGDLKIGDVIQISKMYRQLTAIKRMESELIGVAATMRGFASHLELVRPVLRQSLEEPPK